MRDDSNKILQWPKLDEIRVIFHSGEMGDIDRSPVYSLQILVGELL
jgi:hypothetical protein